MRTLFLGLLLLVPVAAPAATSGPAMRLDAGSVAHHQLVAIGRDLVIEGQALSDVAALQGSVSITGQVDGDVVVLGGNVELGPRARIGGDVFAVGGTVRAAPGARAEGRMVSYPTASSAAITLVEGPSLGLGFASPVVLGVKLALLAAWAALLLVLFAASGRQILETAEGIRNEPLRNFGIGLTGLLALVLTALLFTTFTGGLAGAPLLVLVVLLALLLKLWGMIAVFYTLGEWIARRLLRRPRMRPLNAATIGLIVMGVIKLVPFVGVWVWTAATLIGMGATLSTKFGRREPWFELA